MFYTIKIKSNLNEYSLESSDKDIIQREMDLYFSSFFDVSQEFKEGILKLKFKHEKSDSDSGNINNTKEYVIKDSSSQKKQNIKSLECESDDSKTNSDNKPKDINENSIVEESMTVDNNTVSDDSIIPENIAQNNAVDNVNENITANSSNIKLGENAEKTTILENIKNIIKPDKNYSKQTGMTTREISEIPASKLENSDNIKLCKINDNPINIQDGTQIHISNVQQTESELEYIFKNNNDSIESDSIDNSKSDNEADSIENLINSQNKVTGKISESDPTKNEQEINNNSLNDNKNTSDDENISIMDLEGLEIEVDNLEQKPNNDKNNKSLIQNLLSFGNAKTNSNQNPIQKSPENEANNSANNKTEPLKNEVAEKTNENTNSGLNPEVQSIVNLVENNIELTNINQDSNNGNLMDMFNPENDIELARDIAAFNNAIPAEEIDSNSYYKEQEESYEKNQEFLDSFFANSSPESINTDIKENETTNDSSQNKTVFDNLSNDDNIKIDNNNDISNEAELKFESEHIEISKIPQKPVEEEVLEKTIDKEIQETTVNKEQVTPSPTQEQNTTKGAVLDFKIFKAGFIVEEFVDDFLICAYYIKHILHNESFTMKFINSKLFNATGKFADMSIVDELIVKGYIQDIQGETSIKYAITPEGENYFAAKFQG